MRHAFGWDQVGALGLRARLNVLVLLAGLLLNALVGVPAATAADDPGGARATALRMQQLAAVPVGWTGSTPSCAVGAESAASLQATQEALNILRAAAGLAPVTFDPNLNTQAAAAALIMAAANGLSHSPDPSWPCYSEVGARAAGHSNLALGWTGATAMLAYVLDQGVESLGHRRWALSPSAVSLGSASTATSNALLVSGDAATRRADPGTVVTWPPAGWITANWVPRAWSISVGDGDTAYWWNGSGTTGSPRIIGTPAVTVSIDGQPPVAQAVTELASGFGPGRTFAWTPNLIGTDLAVGDHTIAVQVTGLQVRVSSQPIAYQDLPISYTVGTTPESVPADASGSSPPASTPALTVSATAVRKASRIRIDLGPDQPGIRFRFWLQRATAKGKWKLAGRYRTKGPQLTATVNRRRGTYRVVVPAQNGYVGAVSGSVTLRR